MTKTDLPRRTATPLPTTALAEPTAPSGRLRTMWRSAHTPVPGVPNWARIAAYAVPLTVFPAFLWRIPILFDNQVGGGEKTYIVFLSILSELVAFTAVGLIAAWGERFPRWIPGLGGRAVPILAAVIPATVGAALLTVLWTAGWGTQLAGFDINGEPTRPDFPTQAGGWEATIFYICYLPLLLWGPLLAAVTYAYYRRRKH